MDGTELAISESQERMAVVLSPEDVETFQKKAREENLDATVVAVVTEEPRLRMEWRGDEIVNITRAFLDTNGVTQNAEAEIAAPQGQRYRKAVPACLADKEGVQALKENMARLEVCCQKGLSERFDSSIGAATVLMPFAGKYQLTPEEAMVAKIPLLHGETDDATAMSYGYIPGVARYSPFEGAAYAVVESLSKLAAVGADPLKARLTFQEYFERLHDVPTRWGKPAAALLGALSAQIGMGAALHRRQGQHVRLLRAAGRAPHPGELRPVHDQGQPDPLRPGEGGGPHPVSAAHPRGPGRHARLGQAEGLLPGCAATHRVRGHHRSQRGAGGRRRRRRAAHVLRREAGLPLWGGGFPKRPCSLPRRAPWWWPSPRRRTLPLTRALTVLPLGHTCAKSHVKFQGEVMDLEELEAAWMGTLEKIFPNGAQGVPVAKDVPLWGERNRKARLSKWPSPGCSSPPSPAPTARWTPPGPLRRPGAIPEILVVKNLSVSDIEETIDRMEKAIRNAQIVMLPGGFSGGDEPEGSGKFIATTFRNPKIAQAVTDLLETRDGLMLGICNGFQALIKLGLVPYGKITEPKEDDPTLTFNTLGRHVSRMVYTRVTSVKSPWLAGANPGGHPRRARLPRGGPVRGGRRPPEGPP